MKNIVLDAGPKSSLKWPNLENEIEKVLAKNEKLTFEIDFGFDPTFYNFQDEITYFSLTIAVQEFIKRVSEPYQDHLSHVCLYRGRADFTRAILAHQLMYHSFCEWKHESFGEKSVTPYMLRLFSMHILMDYLHQLAAPLPDSTRSYVEIEGIHDLRPSQLAELLSEEHFPYIQMGKGEENTAFLGVVLPPIGKVNYDALDILLEQLRDIPYRIIPGGQLIDKLNGIDELIVFKEALREEDIRMLKGFEAASGKVIGAEGFEPPTFWSQTRRASQAALCPD